MFLDRLLALGVVVLGVAAAWLGVRWNFHNAVRRGGRDLVTQDGGSPVVLAFSTADCVPCKTVQKPALDELRGRFSGRVQVREVDATIEPALAKRFGIFTVPSTVVIGPQGAIVAVNQGPVGWEKLAGQLGLNGSPRS
jgi:thioredoxin-like negative regulator of GroEL